MAERKIYFGWYVVAAAIVIYALVIGTTFASFGLYILPVSEEFGLSRADINTGLIILNLGNAAMAPIIGRLLDKMSARKLMMACALMMAASMAVISVSDSLLLSGAMIAVPVAAGVLGGGTISVSVLLARWFSVHRGRAMALAALGFSLGGVVIAPIIGQLIEGQGWRTAVLVTGCGSGLLMAVLAYLMRDGPGPGDIEVADRTEPASQGASIEAAPPPAAGLPPRPITILRMPLFWMLSVGIALGSGVSQGIMISLVPIALESGLTMTESAVLISVTGVTGVIAMLALAAWGDRIDRTLLLSLMILASAVPCALLLVAKTYFALFATAMILGFLLAAVAPVYIALMADRFGLAAFGTVRGLLVPVMSLLGALSVRFIGEVYDRTGNYEFGLWTYLLLIVVAAVMVLYSRRMHASTG